MKKHLNILTKLYKNAMWTVIHFLSSTLAKYFEHNTINTIYDLLAAAAVVLRSEFLA